MRDDHFVKEEEGERKQHKASRHTEKKRKQERQPERGRDITRLLYNRFLSCMEATNPYAIKNQPEARKVPSRGFCVS